MRDLSRKIFVLVHGAYHGGWCWDDVAILLRAKGATVLTPTLTGMGERKRERGAYKGLNTFIEDIIAVIEPADLNDVILVGHSFGGMVISGVADRIPERLSRLVYLDAAVPQDGDSMVSQNIQNPMMVNETMIASMQMASMAGDWWPVPSLEMMGLEGASDEVMRREREGVTKHPLSSVIESLRLTRGMPTLPSTYIHCDGPAVGNSSFATHLANIEAGKYGNHWTTSRLHACHMCMLVAPEMTAEILAEVALI